MPYTPEWVQYRCKPCNKACSIEHQLRPTTPTWKCKRPSTARQFQHTNAVLKHCKPKKRTGPKTKPKLYWLVLQIKTLALELGQCYTSMKPNNARMNTITHLPAALHSNTNPPYHTPNNIDLQPAICNPQSATRNLQPVICANINVHTGCSWASRQWSCWSLSVCCGGWGYVLQVR